MVDSTDWSSYQILVFNITHTASVRGPLFGLHPLLWHFRLFRNCLEFQSHSSSVMSLVTTSLRFPSLSRRPSLTVDRTTWTVLKSCFHPDYWLGRNCLSTAATWNLIWRAISSSSYSPQRWWISRWKVLLHCTRAEEHLLLQGRWRVRRREKGGERERGREGFLPRKQQRESLQPPERAEEIIIQEASDGCQAVLPHYAPLPPPPLMCHPSPPLRFLFTSLSFSIFFFFPHLLCFPPRVLPAVSLHVSGLLCGHR